jgi:hypothetical protein
MEDVLDQAAAADTDEQSAAGDPKDYGDPKRLEKLPDRLQRKLHDLLKKAQERDVFARRRELMRVQKNRFFELGFQHTWWDEDQGIFQVGQNGGGIQSDEDGDGPLYQRDIMLYRAFMNSFRAVFCQNQATPRFQAKDPKNGNDITSAQEANKHRRIVEKFNDPSALQDDVGRLLWTDGSVIAISSFVRDARFGYEEEDEEIAAEEQQEAQAQPAAQDGPAAGIAGGGDLSGAGGLAGAGLQTDAGNELSPAPELPDIEGQESGGDSGRTPKGQEVIEIVGVLERKAPLSIRDMARWPYLIVSTEDDISISKGEYSEIEEEIKPGASAPGAEHRARLARIACSQGSSWEGNSESTLEYLVTKDRAWFRPKFFTELGKKDDPDRKELERIFPDGCACVFIGETYCESRNESMDKHIKVMQAVKSNGQNVPGLGQGAVDPCEAFDDMFNMSEEAFKGTIPAKFFRHGVLDLEALNEQTSGYGRYYESNPNADGNPETPFSDNFFEETAVEPPAMMQEAMGQIQGPLLQFLTGQLAPLMGQSDEHNETAKGISILRDQALGLMNLVWKPFTNFYGLVMTDAIRCGAENRPEDKPLSAEVGVPGKEGKEETIDVSIEDLKAGDFGPVPIVDSNFPESWTAKSNRFLQIFQEAAQNPLLLKLMSHPDNQVQAKNLVGLEDMEFPDADAVDKQVEEISRLSKASPIPPSPEEVQATVEQEMQQLQTVVQQGAAAGAPVPQIDPEQLQQKLAQAATQKLTKSSVEVDPICDNHQVEAEECLRWINSPTGQKAKYSSDDQVKLGYQNVRLHLLEHQAVMKQQAQDAAQAAMAQAAGSPGGPGAAPPAAAGASA